MTASRRREIFVQLLADVIASASRGDQRDAEFTSMLLQEVFDQANGLQPDVVTTTITPSGA